MPFFQENFIRRLRNLRENINILLYDSKNVVTRMLNLLSILAALAGIAGLILAYGFENTPRLSLWIKHIFRGIILFYYLKFFIGYLYSFSPRKYFKEYQVNAILLAILLCVFLYKSFLAQPPDPLTGKSEYGMLSSIVEQVAFLVLLVVEIGRASALLPATRLSPQKLFVLSFLLLILAGAALLMLPQMSAEGTKVSFIDALFTSTSASCVTGLSTVDIAATFSLRGQIIIMLLVQFGGLGILTFATFFLILAKRNIGISNQALIKDSLDARNFKESIFLLKDIFIATLAIETIGAILIFFNWSNSTPFLDVYQKAYYSVFHSIAAFNNAGFSLFEGNLFNYFCRNAYMLQIIIAVLAILGGIGFPVLKDIFSDSRKRFLPSVKRRWSLNTRIVVFTSCFLIVLGTVLFMVFEWNHSLQEHSLGGKIVVSFFQSASSRTSGFNSVDFGQVLNPTLLLLIILMFIGASPASTGGGVKTTTFFILFVSAINTVRGKQRVNIEHSQIPDSTIFRAMTILLFSMLFVTIGTIVLTFTDSSHDLIELVFEEISAFTTTGLSTGITSVLSDGGKITLIVSMFMGRIGLLTFGFALTRRMKPEPAYKYPEAHVILG